MTDLRIAAEQLEKSLRENGADKYYLVVSDTEMREFNAENGEFTLLRTVESGSASAKVFKDGRAGAAAGSDISEEGLARLAADCAAAAASADPDPAWDLAPAEAPETFNQGVWEPEMDQFFSRVTELLKDIKEQYPQVLVMLAIASHRRVHSLYRNTNGTEFEGFSGVYNFMIEFSATEGERSTSINFDELTLTDLSKPFIEQGFVRKRLENSILSLSAKPLSGKFEGTVVFTPDCLEDFIGMLITNFASDSVLIDGTSLWKDSVGSKVAADCVSIAFRTEDPRNVITNRYTAEGFRCEDLSFIENGVLKTHLLSLYAANKTGRSPVKTSSTGMVVAPGEKSLDEIISGIDKGLIIGYFSGGEPGTNGEFSGVAKNSFLIENGKIAGAVTETMINGKLGDVFANAFAASKEVRCSGTSVLPYLAATGVVISGK